MYSFYNFFLNRKWSGPLFGKAFRVGLRARGGFHALRNGVGTVLHPAAALKHPPERSSLKRVLMIRIDRIGDIVLSTPSLRALRNALPDAEIDYVVQKKYAPLLNAYEGWNRVFTLQNIDGVKERLSLAKILRQRNYDAVIIGSTAPSGYRLAWDARVPIRIGWRAKGYGYLLSAGFRDDRGRADRHQVENNLKLLEPLAVRDPAPVFPVRETDSGREQLRRFLAEHGIFPEERILVLHPGSFSPRVRWPLERFAEVAKSAEARGFRTVLLGSGAEGELVENIWAMSGRKALKIVNRFDLEGLVSFLKFAHVFVGNSTGPMHVSASVGTWTLAIFGSRYPLDRHELWRPWGPKGIVIEARDVPCCGMPWTCADMPCLTGIPASQVWNAILEVWEKK